MSLSVSHLRVAYFPDSFHEVNGVAHTSRNFVAYAKRHDIQMLCVRAGKTTRLLPPEGSVQPLELGRSRIAIPLEQDLYFDPLFFRYSNLISETVRRFQPNVIHITGPSELGMFGKYFAWKLGIRLSQAGTPTSMSTPLAACNGSPGTLAHRAKRSSIP